MKNAITTIFTLLFFVASFVPSLFGSALCLTHMAEHQKENIPAMVDTDQCCTNSECVENNNIQPLEMHSEHKHDHCSYLNLQKAWLTQALKNITPLWRTIFSFENGAKTIKPGFQKSLSCLDFSMPDFATEALKSVVLII